VTDRAASDVATGGTPAGHDSPMTYSARDRALFANFLQREIATRYLGSVTGFAWALLNPLAALAVYHFVFTHIFRATGFAGQSFLAFVAIALWPWLAAQEALQRGAISVAGYSGLIRKVAFPHELVVFASVTATFALQFAGYLAVLAVLKIAGEPIHLRGLLIAVPVWIVLLVGVTGLTMLLAALQVFVKDVEHVLTSLLMMLMCLTPILYPLTLVPEALRPWVAANPFGWVVMRLRDGLLEGQLAPRPSDAVALACALAFFFAGRWVFRRLSPHFEDFV
jgi:ABC-type polysaccharide/polyol phosphate export permease